ncbi:MAG: OsmC family protein [Phenylobacterium sp.]|nr:OsmC family protein [Phenylobacterium sp.]
MLEYAIQARRIDAHGSLASAKDATLVLDTDLQGRPDAFNPVELLLAAVAACMIKGVERVTPLLNFELNGVEVRLKAARQDSPPLITSIDYEIIVDTAESDQRLDLLHKNIRKYGTISNTVGRATALDGRIIRRAAV